MLCSRHHLLPYNVVCSAVRNREPNVLSIRKRWWLSAPYASIPHFKSCVWKAALEDQPMSQQTTSLVHTAFDVETCTRNSLKTFGIASTLWVFVYWAWDMSGFMGWYNHRLHTIYQKWYTIYQRLYTIYQRYDLFHWATSYKHISLHDGGTSYNLSVTYGLGIVNAEPLRKTLR